MPSDKDVHALFPFQDTHLQSYTFSLHKTNTPVRRGSHCYRHRCQVLEEQYRNQGGPLSFCQGLLSRCCCGTHYFQDVSTTMSAALSAPWTEWVALVNCLDWLELSKSVVSASHVWLVGLCVGLIFPRHKQLSNFRGFILSALTIGLGVSAHSQVVSRLAMLINGAIFFQSLWYRWTDPGAD